MSREYNDIIKEVMKSNTELHKVDTKLTKEIAALDKELQGVGKEIQSIKKDIKNISSKIDDVLDILNTLSIFIEDAENIIQEDDSDDDYQSNEGWLPEVNNWEENYNEDENDD